MSIRVTPPPPALWGGLEGTVNRVGDRYFSQIERSGHLARADDLQQFAALGIRALRYPVLWECVAPDGLRQANWRWADARLATLRELGIEPIAGLVHHGSGPRHTSLTDPAFAGQLAEFAGAVARRYPWLRYYTPVNEPLTTARFSGLYGVWYPHGRSDATFLRALVNQCRGVVLSMQAIRRVNPLACLVQTEDLGKSYGTPQVAHHCAFYNQRRWLSWDLLCGLVEPRHPLWHYLTVNGIGPDELHWFLAHPCPPDIIGVNYYITSERWLDHRLARYGPEHIGNGGFADIEAARALATPLPGIGPLLDEVWQRYHLPIAITETHIDSRREDQLRWLMEIWLAAQQAHQRGVALTAVTVWALLGSYDWNCLVTEARGYYETGAFDLRSTPPRPTAVAALMRELASGRGPSHPVLSGRGWWRRQGRFFCPPVAFQPQGTDGAHLPAPPPPATGNGRAATRGAGRRGAALVQLWPPRGVSAAAAAPILIAGRNALGRAFARYCGERDLACVLLDRTVLDCTERGTVDAAVALYRPWAMIYAGAGPAPQPAANDPARCWRDNVVAPALLAAVCASTGIQLLTFSSEHVFDGVKAGTYVESDAPAPACDYGRNKAEADRRVLSVLPQALVVRSGPLFSVDGDDDDDVTQPGDGAGAGWPGVSPQRRLSATYLPDLVHACLDLLIDGARGLWHLHHGEALTKGELAERCRIADGATMLARPGPAAIAGDIRQHLSGTLGSERGILLGTLEEAVRHYALDRQSLPSPDSAVARANAQRHGR